MSKIQFQQDVLAPNRDWSGEFKNVPKPTFVIAEMNDIAKWNWRVSSSCTFTDRLEWDVTGDPVHWYGEWRYKDKKDIWTTIWIKVACQGTYDKKTKTGNIVVRVKPTMTTELEWHNPFTGMLYYMYFNTFYRPVLRRYLADSQAKVRSFDAELRERFGITHAHVRESVNRRPG